MGSKATFDSVARVIYLTEAPVLVDGDYLVTIDVKTDLYSDGKHDWLANERLRRVQFPIAPVGGQDKPGGKLGSTFFLDDRWSIASYDADHRLQVVGNFYRNNGTTPFTPRPSRTLVVEQERSALVEAIESDIDNVQSAVWSADLSAYPKPQAGGLMYEVWRLVKTIIGLVV